MVQGTNILETKGELEACPEILVSDEEVVQWNTPWKNTSVVNVLGKKISFEMLEAKLHRSCVRDGRIRIIDMPWNYYVVQFSSPEDYKHALYNGPWMIADHYLLVQHWKPFFSANEEERRTIE